MSSNVSLDSPADDDPEDGSSAAPDLEAQLELFAEENRRLREQSRRLRQSQYRRTALGLGILGLLAGAGAVLFPPVRDVLLALMGIGLFSAVLVYFLTPERFIAASIGESVYGAYARSAEELIADLGLKDSQVYVPVGSHETRLFIPQHVDYRVPDEDDLDGVLVVPDDEQQRGVSLHPTGGDLFVEFERTLSEDLADEPIELGQQLTDALVEVFELVESASVSPTTTAKDNGASRLPGPDDTEADGQFTIAVHGSLYGEGTAIDHPVTSVVACGFARQLDRPVIAEVTRSSDSDVDFYVTIQWRAFVFD